MEEDDVQQILLMISKIIDSGNIKSDIISIKS